MNRYVMADIHGDMDLYQKAMEYVKSRGEYQIIFLGDAIDRGSKGYEIAKDLVTNPNVIYIKGNHEEFMVRGIYEVKDFCYNQGITVPRLWDACDHNPFNVADMTQGEQMRIWMWNGGATTFHGWAADKFNMDIIYKLGRSPVKYSIDNIDFCHAGCEQKQWETNDAYAMMWNRSHFDEPWFDGRKLYHGHTPIDHIYHYANIEIDKVTGVYDNKVDMDHGTASNQQLAVTNIDTEETIIFNV